MSSRGKTATIVAGLLLVGVIYLIDGFALLPPHHTLRAPRPVSTSTTTTTAPKVTRAPHSVSLVPIWEKRLIAAWTPVAVCEEGGWVGWSGPNYPDSIGINAHNWSYWGGTSDVSPIAQIRVGQRIEAALGRPPGHIPDHPCGAGY